jgi:DNA-binding CsgD family transcriptional regulator
MRSDALRRIEAAISDAALDPDQWSVALQLVTRATDTVGAAVIVRDNRTNSAQWVNFVGESAELAAPYIDYYSKLDRYSIFLEQSPSNRLIRLSEAIPQSDLRTDEWYNDFVLKCGVGDLVGSRIHGSDSHTVLLGIHEGIGRAPLTPESVAGLNQLLKPIGRAAQLQLRMHEFGWRSLIALRSLDHLSAGVIVSDGTGRVIEMNVIAEQIIREGDGLRLRQGKLFAHRAFETGKLAALLSAATATNDMCAIGHMAIGRPNNKAPYLLSVAPLETNLTNYGRPVALTLVIDPDARLPTHDHLAGLFGLSPAESRVAIAIMSGKLIRDIATELGVEIATLRTQLRSIFHKVGVKRQADLVRVLANIPVGRASGWGAVRDWR